MGQTSPRRQKASDTDVDPCVSFVKRCARLRPKKMSFHARLQTMSPGALLELEEKTQELIDIDQARALVDAFYALDVTSLNDEQFALLESLIDQSINILSAVPI